VIEPRPCCAQVVADLHSAHKRLAAVELQLLVLQAHNDNLTTELAAVTFERDQLLRAQAAQTIHNIREEAA